MLFGGVSEELGRGGFDEWGEEGEQHGWWWDVGGWRDRGRRW